MVSQTVSQTQITRVFSSPADNKKRLSAVEIYVGRVGRFSQQQKAVAAKWKLKAKTMTQLLTYGDVQMRLRLSRSSVIRLIDQGLLERIYVLGAPRITDTEVERFITKQTRATRLGQVGA